MTTSDSTGDTADIIAAAIARLRGRPGPRPPWQDGWVGGPPWMHDHHPGPGGTRGGPHGGPHGGPWMAARHARFAGPARLRLLDALAAASDPLTVSELADAIGVDQPRASRLVQQAVEMGLVQREADPDDARRTRIVLTEQGSAIVRGFRGDRREAVASALRSFTEAERTELARLLSKLADAWPR